MPWIKTGRTWLVDHFIEHWPAYSVLAGGSVMTYLASASAWLSSYGPVAWGGVGVATVLALSLSYFLFELVRPHSIAAQPAPTANGTQSAPAVKEKESAPTWLEQLANEDDQQMPNRMLVQTLSATNEPHLDAPNPYVDLNLAFINASVFTLSPVRVDGRFQYRGYDLQALPELLKKPSIRHADYQTIVIRQWLTREIAKEISGNRPVSIDTGYVAVWFSYSNVAGEPKEARSSIGNGVLVIA